MQATGQDQEARAALRRRALEYVERVENERDALRNQVALADGLMSRLRTQLADAEAERDRLRERAQAAQGIGSGAALADELAKEAGRSIELRRATEDAINLLNGAGNMVMPALTNVAAAERKLKEAVKKWKASA